MRSGSRPGMISSRPRAMIPARLAGVNGDGRGPEAAYPGMSGTITRKRRPLASVSGPKRVE